MARVNFLCALCVVQRKLNYPSEYLQQIEGSYDEVCFRDSWQRVIAITSITFKSNFTAFGPYGSLENTLSKVRVGK
jgi:hypothetical protein